MSQNLSSAVQYLTDWLRNRGLILNERKTQIMPRSPVLSQTFDLQVQCNGLPLPTVRSAKYLGLHFYADRSGNTMVGHVTRGIASKVGVLRRYATFLPFQCRIDYFHSFILLHMMYAASSYLPFLTAYQSRRLNLLSTRDVLTRHDQCHCDTRDVLERHESVRNYIDPAFLPWRGVELYRCTEDS